LVADSGERFLICVSVGKINILLTFFSPTGVTSRFIGEHCVLEAIQRSGKKALKHALGFYLFS
jgi:hypothetical protein